jgi:RHS repeat-associated protein
VAEVAFAPDGVRGSENLLFNYALGEIRDLDRFLGNWHQARIAYDMTDYTGSVWIDAQPIVSGVPLRTDLDVERAPEIALRRGPEVAVKLWIDDLDVRFVDVSRMGEDWAKLVFRPLFRDNFNRYESDLFPGGGWLQGPGRLAGEAGSPGREAEEDAKVRRKAAVVDDRVYASSSRSFKLEGSEEEPGTVMKRFSLPDRVPFAVSAEAFVIVGPGEGGRVERGSLAGSERVSGEDGKLRKRESEDADRERNRPALNQRSDRPRREASSVKLGIESTAGSERMMSGPYPSGTFYIYSFDGRLLAEYDVLGNWVKDYIYFGGQLVAEQRAGALYYYASDQIRSTRIVTDSSGNVVYSAAHEPYGGIQKTWVTNYDPELKFSGKERDAESGLDYFGARYYDRTQYRFLSVDPIFSQFLGQFEPQKLNRYLYCFNNPVSMFDPSGRWPAYAVHYLVPFRIGNYLEMPPSLTATIAEACMNVDLNPATTAGDLNNPSTWIPAIVNLATGVVAKWHFADETRLDECYQICLHTLDPKEFGQNLHVIMDYLPHKPYNGYIGHGPLPADDINKHPAEYEATCWIVFDLMSDFFDRYTTALIAAVQQVAIAISLATLMI